MSNFRYNILILYSMFLVKFLQNPVFVFFPFLEININDLRYLRSKSVFENISLKRFNIYININGSVHQLIFGQWLKIPTSLSYAIVFINSKFTLKRTQNYQTHQSVFSSNKLTMNMTNRSRLHRSLVSQTTLHHSPKSL